MTNVDRLRYALEEGNIGIGDTETSADACRGLLGVAEWIDVTAGRILETGRVPFHVADQIEYLGARVNAWRIGDNGGKA
jgi:hypothetical protein